MRRPLRTRWWLVAALAFFLPTRPAVGQPKASPTDRPAAESSANEPKTREQLEAQQHFQRAKDLYQAGSYREAIAALEQARSLDPKAKDLVFNLGIVHEKLARFDEAIVFFRQYLAMEGVTAAERAKAETIIKRIEGAKRELPDATAPGPAARRITIDPPPPPPPAPRAGRLDAATVTAGSIAVVGLGVGTAFGLLALANRPGADFTTGRDGSYDALKAKASDAHTQAVVADVGFGVGLVAAVATAYLYFGRPREARSARTPPGGLRVVPAAVASGGVLLVGGAFQ
jgi:tetratricopeptide (TPR) repeat protein